MISLPIDLVLPDLREALANRHEVILEAPPGAGKTTRVPLGVVDTALPLAVTNGTAFERLSDGVLRGITLS